MPDANRQVVVRSGLPVRTDALKSQTTHSFRPGAGYRRHTTLPTAAPAGAPTDKCTPPAVTADGARVMLKPPGGRKPLQFTWVAAEQAWARPGGNRMAWPAAYLSAHGWRLA